MTKNRYCERIGRQHKSNNGKSPESALFFILKAGTTVWPSLNFSIRS